MNDWLRLLPSRIPAESVIHVWAWQCDDVSPLLAGCLTVDEQATVARGLIPAVRQRALASKVGLRYLLAAYLQRDPAQVELTTSAEGKPRLAGTDPALHFNLSHAGEWIVAAVGVQPLGVDMEVARSINHLEELAERVMTSSELQAWRLKPDAARPGDFLTIWTCKEAVTKLDGRGLQLPMAAIALDRRTLPYWATWRKQTCCVYWQALGDTHLAVASVAAAATLSYHRLAFEGFK